MAQKPVENVIQFNNAYSPSRKVQMIPKGESLTEQHHAESLDVHNVIKKYDRTGILSNVQKGKAMYGDFTKVNEYQDALDLVNNSKSLFNELPSDIREKFSNNAGEFFEWITNPANNSEAIELGLVKAPKGQAPNNASAKTEAKEAVSPPAPQDAAE